MRRALLWVSCPSCVTLSKSVHFSELLLWHGAVCKQEPVLQGNVPNHWTSFVKDSFSMDQGGGLVGGMVSG